MKLIEADNKIKFVDYRSECSNLVSFNTSISFAGAVFTLTWAKVIQPVPRTNKRQYTFFILGWLFLNTSLFESEQGTCLCFALFDNFCLCSSVNFLPFCASLIFFAFSKEHGFPNPFLLPIIDFDIFNFDSSDIVNVSPPVVELYPKSLFVASYCFINSFSLLQASSFVNSSYKIKCSKLSQPYFCIAE